MRWLVPAVSYAKVPQSYVFRNKGILYPSAIVLTMPMGKDRIGQAPEIAAGREVWRAYDRLGRAVNDLAEFLRDRGYGAQGGAALGGDVNYVRLAQDAGLGWIGTHGVLKRECFFQRGLSEDNGRVSREECQAQSGFTGVM